MTNKFIIQGNCSGMKLGVYARSVLGYSAKLLKDIKYNGRITVNGADVFTNYLLKEGDVLELTAPKYASENIEPVNIPLDIIYEDDDLLAVNKPYNMPVHPSIRHRDDTLANAVMYYYKDELFTYRVLTRLDIDTTGVVIIAKNAHAANRFSFSEPMKKYIAVCVGAPAKPEGEICAPIVRDEGIIKRRIDENGKYALTKYRVLGENNGLSLVEACPVTGRTHQIRLHLSYIGCPVYGDFLYGTEIPGERTRLHCLGVYFNHPITGAKTSIETGFPKDFEFAFDCLK